MTVVETIAEPVDGPAGSSLPEKWARSLDSACGRIAPTWPLDRLIAVNPFWEMRDRPHAEVAARLAALARVSCLMPRSHYAALWEQQIGPDHLRRAAIELDVPFDRERLLAHLRQPTSGLGHWHNISDLLDSDPDRGHHIAWRDEITHQISQFCAAVFQEDGPLRESAAAPTDLYGQWLAVARNDRGISIVMGEAGLQHQFDALPGTADELLCRALTELAVADRVVADYAHALLLDINGWASWVAYLRWQDRLAGHENQLMRELLAIRMAWELALWRHQVREHGGGRLGFLWRQQMRALPELLTKHREAQRLTWVWQRAAEIAYQGSLAARLRQPPRPRPAPVLQAAFCIDVRSEAMRRALEAQDPAIQTLGFAGFFGLPLAYRPPGTPLARPQLPGLLKPDIEARPADDPDIAADAGRRHNREARWQETGDAAPATFSVVEATGLWYAFKLLRDSLFPADGAPGEEAPAAAWELRRDDTPLDTAAKADLAAGVLRTMGLTRGFAERVLLVGHGAQTRNNPHARGLDCGACGGQTGEVNARVLAHLLNDGDVRAALRGRGIDIPAHCRFLAALHDTTTDELRCLDTDAADDRLAGWLREAGRQARRERSRRLGLDHLDDDALQRAVEQRARDWSQVRPEWGLAGNAAFIVAPRERTAHVDLGGRCFLHDYCWWADEEFDVLEQIMTAPMVVTHWINMQYNASVTDNLKYGSGNKVLHNVVGGNIGVFEGNGGDLRIGLPLQSLHDGLRWMHEPLRLSVFIQAPREPIAAIAKRHAAVRQLIDNEWLYLLRLDDAGNTVERLYLGAWWRF